MYALLSSFDKEPLNLDLYSFLTHRMLGSTYQIILVLYQSTSGLQGTNGVGQAGPRRTDVRLRETSA